LLTIACRRRDQRQWPAAALLEPGCQVWARDQVQWQRWSVQFGLDQGREELFILQRILQKKLYYDDIISFKEIRNESCCFDDDVA
jgi:hypothetical protein